MVAATLHDAGEEGEEGRPLKGTQVIEEAAQGTTKTTRTESQEGENIFEEEQRTVFYLDMARQTKGRDRGPRKDPSSG